MNEWNPKKSKEKQIMMCACVWAHTATFDIFIINFHSPHAPFFSFQPAFRIHWSAPQDSAEQTHTHAQWNGTNINYDGRKGCSLTGLFAWTNKIWDNSRNLTNLNCFWKKRPGRATQKKAIKNPIIKSRLKSTTVREYDLYDVRRRTAVLWCHIHIRVEERNICNSHILNIIILLFGPKWTHHTLNNNFDVCFFLSLLFCFVLFSLLTSTIQRECESLFTGMCHVRGQIRHLVIVYSAFNWLQSSRSFSLHCVECLRHFNFLRCADTLLPNETICIPDVSFSIHSSLLSSFLYFFHCIQ